MKARAGTTEGAAVHYRIAAADRHAHLYRVTLSIAEPTAPQQVSLAVWIPGSYLVREFSKHLQGLHARQGGQELPLRQLDKCSWQVDCRPGRPLVLEYQVYAFDPSVRAAWLAAERGFFNATSLCLRVEGQQDRRHRLELVATESIANEQVATAAAPLKIDKRGFGTYQYASYDELADCPVETGAFWSGHFSARGVPHRFVVAGAPPSFDGERLLADARRICEAAIAFWHGARPARVRMPPYLFLLNAVDAGYGGLEHRDCTALICNRRDLPRLGENKQPEGYTTLLGLISHEYFHRWNVKRLKPAEFARYDYARENYTELLWFFEGFTSYYDELLLRRAGLIDDAAYLKLLGKTVNQTLQTPGRAVQSVAQASFDAWVKYYRPDENTPNATVSYYGKGALVALCFDLTLRAEKHTTLDQVMRALWTRCRAGAMREDDFAAVLQELGGRSFGREIAAWVHGTAELPLRALLERHGVAVLDEPAQLAQRLGLRVEEERGVRIKTVLRGGAAEAAGFAAGDEWIAVEVGPGRSRTGWRLAKLDDLLLYAGARQRGVAIVARDQRLLRLELALPRGVTTWRLALQNAALAQPWLAAQE
ncbi:MAG: Putative protease [Burkholderiaceae bacterium]|nr:MAG: Putative protease [Burkholderiaceae bacterium]